MSKETCFVMCMLPSAGRNLQLLLCHYHTFQSVTSGGFLSTPSLPITVSCSVSRSVFLRVRSGVSLHGAVKLFQHWDWPVCLWLWLVLFLCNQNKDLFIFYSFTVRQSLSEHGISSEICNIFGLLEIWIEGCINMRDYNHGCVIH